jgi:hypothetical protein
MRTLRPGPKSFPTLLAALPLALALGLATGAAADAPRKDMRQMREMREMRQMRGEERGAMKERVREKMHAFLTTELSARLQLDERKKAQLSDALKTHMERRQAQRQQLRVEGQKLKGLVDAKAADAEVKKQLDIVLGLAGNDDEILRFVEETSKFLTVTEQARLALALPEMMRDMKHMMRAGQGKGRGPFGGGGFGGGGPGGGPGGDAFGGEER